MKTSVFGILSTLSVSVLLGWAPASLAQDRQNFACVGVLPVRVVEGNVIVPTGARCVLGGSLILGNLIIEPTGSLDARVVIVGGNVQGNGQSDVAIEDSSIRGDLQLQYGQGSYSLTRNTVGGDLQFFFNDGPSDILDNIIKGNLQCEGNNPPPGHGGNVTGGNQQGQCGLPQ
jgi:hypothetical protein